MTGGLKMGVNVAAHTRHIFLGSAPLGCCFGPCRGRSQLGGQALVKKRGRRSVGGGQNFRRLGAPVPPGKTCRNRMVKVQILRKILLSMLLHLLAGPSEFCCQYHLKIQCYKKMCYIMWIRRIWLKTLYCLSILIGCKKKMIPLMTHTQRDHDVFKKYKGHCLCFITLN